MISDHYDNVRRIEGIVRSLDSEKPRVPDGTPKAAASER